MSRRRSFCWSVSRLKEVQLSRHPVESRERYKIGGLRGCWHPGFSTVPDDGRAIAEHMAARGRADVFGGRGLGSMRQL